jgi:DNA-binding PadR family transcriptional regulator
MDIVEKPARYMRNLRQDLVMLYPQLHWKAVRLLQVTNAEGGEVRTSVLKDHVDYPDGVNHHVQALLDEGLIEKSGEVIERKGQYPTHVYRITDEGWEAIADGLTERVCPTVTTKKVERLTSRVDQLEEKVEEREHEELVDTVGELTRDVDTLKREVQNRASEVQIDTLTEKVGDVNEELAILSARIEDRATEEELEEVRATVENNERYNTILQELGSAAAMRDPNAEKYKQLRHLIALLVALERYLEASDIDIWAYHPSDTAEEA